SLVEKQGAKIKVKLSDDSLELEGDRFYWTQILFNLIENALKQNSSLAVKVKVSARLNDDETLSLSIADNGVGIPSADLPYIFNRFYRVEKHHSQGRIKGTGLGLSIVKRAVEAHHGDISAHSVPGVETRFDISVPLRQNQGDAKKLPAAARAS
ncbi:MAG: sensor histidine kinase, partial [Verrucomicrobiales bacterium]